MRNITRYLLLCVVLAGLCGCIREEDYADTPEGNFEALWRLIDEQYCFLDYKQQEYGLDWDEVYVRYRKRISQDMPAKGLFEVLGEMLDELRDGHVNLYSSADVARYWDWFEGYPANFSDSIQRCYLGTDYKIASGLRYKILEDNIGYVYYGSFNDGLGEGNLDQVLYDMAICDGLILDVRNNGGGLLTNASKLASRFTNEPVLTGYILHKTGKGHSDFSQPEPVYLEPSKRIRWQKRVVVLMNRHTYSAANDFVNSMSRLPRVTLMGDRSGGGSGLPMSSELPNGWSVRYSSSPHLDAEMHHIEFGVEPDVKVDMMELDWQQGRDTMIETARTLLKEGRN
ncbi:MAG: S41 family peptidase [Bacteroidaceae bacterium]